MVSQKKIREWSKQFNVAPEVIDKDRVLGHLLNAFYSSRDIYDIWYIINSNIDINKSEIINLLMRKANSKGIEISGVEQFVNDNKQRKNKRAWQSSLSHHLPSGKLPDIDSVYGELKRFIDSVLMK